MDLLSIHQNACMEYLFAWASLLFLFFQNIAKEKRIDSNSWGLK